MKRAGIALGSNIGDRLSHLITARAMISDLPLVLSPILASPVYETAPVDCEPGTESFLNAVVEIEYSGDARTLLCEMRNIESVLGRSPVHPRNTSRIIDLDLLYYGEIAIKTQDLEVPHPRMHERRFVLQPLSDIRPDLALPSQQVTVGKLLQQLSDTSSVVRSSAQW
ncbi:MAG: 2-amino-4-hydroxy-6-hydroxymethyldihydropteridine diphosphokinase [Chthoniobacterales bacterium]|nr:2-amino-4-hydroxy-6-hydroxymethyldihydropteridine diphosphokinase [Chthoniobacterales bacterium]